MAKQQDRPADVIQTVGAGAIGAAAIGSAEAKHPYLATPSMRTVQAPHSPRSQPTFVPVNCSRSRIT